MSLHKVPLCIILGRGAQFTSWFWRSFQRGVDTQVKLSTSFYSQIEDQEKHTIQTLKDMIRAYH